MAGKYCNLIPYNFSLDSNPLERWDHILEDNKNKIPYIENYLDTHINKKYQKYTNILGDLVSKNLPKSYSDELLGISNKIKSFNNRYIDVGIAEEHAITYAAGISAAGILPIITIYKNCFWGHNIKPICKNFNICKKQSIIVSNI